MTDQHHEVAPHEPVMVHEITDLLAQPGPDPAVLIDCTLGAAGHAMHLLAASGPNVHLIGFDRDQSALDLSTRRLAAFAQRVHLIHAPFSELAEHATDLAANLGPVKGILWDLGVSSMQLDQAERGFSFRQSGAVDMRMDPSQGQSAGEYIQSHSVHELAAVIGEYGEETAPMRVAEAIKANAPYADTLALADVIADALPNRVVQTYRKKGINPATKVFQALRIAVNGELDQFTQSLPQAVGLVHTPSSDDPALAHEGGILAVLTYHSLEDRIAKQFFAQEISPCVCPPGLPTCGCLRRPRLQAVKRGFIAPSHREVLANPRARSAKLRATRACYCPPTELET